jgi:hypothetical protein
LRGEERGDGLLDGGDGIVGGKWRHGGPLSCGTRWGGWGEMRGKGLRDARPPRSAGEEYESGGPGLGLSRDSVRVRTIRTVRARWLLSQRSTRHELQASATS